jgi:hypothetical protein
LWIPIISAISSSGRGTAMDSTKSQWPVEATWSIASVVISRNVFSSFFTMRGVKPRLIRLRSCVCRGSPSSIRPSLAGVPGRTPSAEVKRSWFLETASTSSNFEITHRPDFPAQ